jgi:hypothetical protein
MRQRLVPMRQRLVRKLQQQELEQRQQVRAQQLLPSCRKQPEQQRRR